MRTIPNISHLFEPLEAAIRSSFLSILVGDHSFSDADREIYSLPTRFGGLAIFNPVEMTKLEYENSAVATRPLHEFILQQKITDTEGESKQLATSISEAKKAVSVKKELYYKQRAQRIKEKSSDEVCRNLDIISQKRDSSWLTALPLEEFRYTLLKQEFTDAILLRYRHPIKALPKTCACS